jgi:hypothetical protein
MVELRGTSVECPIALSILVGILCSSQTAEDSEQRQLKPRSYRTHGNTDKYKMRHAGHRRADKPARRYLARLVTSMAWKLPVHRELDLPLRLATPCFLEGHVFRVSEVR